MLMKKLELNISIGVIISDKFMELASADLPCYTFYPHSVYLEYGKYLDDLDMNEWYEKLVANPKVKKKKLM
ncbi:Ribonucleoside-diphosphate reductase subunit alpha [Streptobacillus moniliformis]|nr:Ribonucleoside-diphosphate reductase subunit alpha [Streptobacillus moniliformis]